MIVRTPGYKDGYYVLAQGSRHPAYYPLLLLDVPFIYGLFLDAANISKFFRFAPVNNLSGAGKYISRANNEKYIHLEAIKLEIIDKGKDLKEYYGVSHAADIMEEMDKAERDKLRYEQRQEERNARKKYKNAKLTSEDNQIIYEDTKFSENVYNTLKKTGYIDTVNQVFTDNNNILVLEGIIRKASVFHIYDKGASNYNKAKVNITWNVKNSFGEIIDSVSGWSYSGDFVYNASDKGAKMFADAVDNSYMSLLKNRKLAKHLRVDTSFNIADPLLRISAPAKAVREVSEAGAATITIKREGGGHGTGFAITNDGYILTNYHVIAGKTISKLANITVLLSNGEEVPVSVVRYNKMRDVALLKVNKSFETAFNLSDAKTFKNLMEVYTIGTPKSLELGQSVSLGLISNERKSNNNNLLQLSMSINPGNSGGPLFEKGGTLQGIVTSKLVGYATEGVGFAIPAYLVPAYLNLSLK